MSDNDVTKFGNFQLLGHEVWGQVKLAGSSTELILRTEGQRVNLSAPDIVQGRLHDFTLISCVNCVGGELPTQAWNSTGETSTSWSVFPHQVLTGKKHFNPSKDKVRRAWFSTGDIHLIFDDFDSFGMLLTPTEQLRSLIPTAVGNRPIAIGSNPMFAYFAGRKNLLSVQLIFGKLELQYWVSPRSDSRGARIEAQVRVQVEFNQAVEIAECLQYIANIGQFLSLIAGRAQGIDNVQVDVNGDEEQFSILDLYWSLGPQQENGQELDTPSWRDMPLDGIRRTEEFVDVMQRWFASDISALARARLYSCRQMGNKYTPDRLVAAANLFDLKDALLTKEISSELARAQNECLLVLKAVPQSDDRDSAIQAIKRIGNPTLMKKVLARADLLRGHFHLVNLDKILRQAILCRNYFVHGSGDTRFNYLAVNSHMHFLTETLEFVFAAAELIECGWNANGWRLRPHTGHHWFSRFVSDYELASSDLLSDLAKQRG